MKILKMTELQRSNKLVKISEDTIKHSVYIFRNNIFLNNNNNNNISYPKNIHKSSREASRVTPSLRRIKT